MMYAPAAKLPHVDMIEVPGTSVEAKDPPGVAQFTALLARYTAPVFEAAAGAPDLAFTEVVAVCYRDAAGKPVHGGLFGFDGAGVTSLALKASKGQVDTSRDPAHAAFGLVLMRGPLVFRQQGADQRMQISIVDIHADRAAEPLQHPTPGRDAVRTAYLNVVLPSVEVVQPLVLA